jgi:hypothetical protein
MIKTELRDGELVPVVVCEHCGHEIEDIGLGAVVVEPVEGGGIVPVHFVHKGDCHDRMENAVFLDAGVRPGWVELRKFVSRFQTTKEA